MDSCDVLIVGGGPAGSSCAWGLRRSGLDVVVLDKQTFPRDKVCGGWITPGVLNALDIDPIQYASQRMLQPITGFRVGSIGGQSVKTGYCEPVSYGIRRREFDDYLLRRSGARLLLGTALSSLERVDDTWIANDEVRARVVVGAGGHFCPVARLTGSKTGATGDSEPAVVAQETEFQMDARQQAACSIRSDTPELYFCSDMRGYGWCFRKGDILNVGLGRADLHGLPAHVAAFLKFLKSDGRIAFDVPPLRGHAYLLSGMSSRKVVGDGLLLAGDAAGLAYPQSGEGIRPAVDSGLLAARNIVEARGKYSRQNLEVYRREISAQSHLWSTKISGVLPGQWIGAVARQLLKTHWFVRKVVLNQWFLDAHPARRQRRRQSDRTKISYPAA
jgi:geranylgeranyl reductase family protein